VVQSLAESGAEQLLAADIDDGVVLSLLDGGEYKSTDRLSTGQRCTVVLPILLSHHGEVLVVDQPEDNLDNAFVTDTLVQAITDRKAGDQIIFATHNANIPVLGDAERVVVMDSDGRRAFVRVAAPLDDPRSVTAITTLMEGGIEAFRRRAEFYARFASKL
jgi:energy-coupling factor transporter ATP-binding protein EcfA2